MKNFLRTIFLLVAFEAVIALGHWIIYRTLIDFSSVTDPVLLWRLRLTFTILSLGALFVLVLINRLASPLVDKVYALVATWLGTIHFLVLGSAIFWILVLADSYAGWGLDWFALGLGAFTLSLLTSAYGIIHAGRTKLIDYELDIPDLPNKWHGRKIALLADVHVGSIRNKRFAQKMVRLINARHPDVLIIAGDYFDGPFSDFKALASPLSGVDAPLGIRFVGGNHEEFHDHKLYTDALQSVGVDVLNDRFTEIDGLQFVGVAYSSSNTSAKLDSLLASIPFDRSKPSVLVKHSPLGIKVALKYGFRLMLCGHTHRAQMWPYTWITRLIFGRFEYGLNREGEMQVVTTSGAGTGGPPQRLGTHGEIVFITLK